MADISRALENAWHELLAVLEKIIIPDWNDVIGWLPILLVIGLIGPVLTLLVLYWAWVHLRRDRPRIAYGEAAAHPAMRNEEGFLVVPANVPYCPRDGLIHPPGAVDCERCHRELIVRCPVDETTRTARTDLCRACGTRYVLGATRSAVTVRRRREPPEGGAALA